jgi:hypothetical protein
MWNDPIVEEVRRTREEYAARFNHDLEAIFRDLQDQQEQARREGWEVVSLPPRRPEHPASTAA